MASAVVATGCGAGGQQPVAVARPHTAVDLGQTVTTSRGNQVQVLRYLPQVAGLAAPAGEAASGVKVRVCAAAGNRQGATITRKSFLLLFHDGWLHPRAIAGTQLQLAEGRVPPGRCASGWLTYLRPRLNQPIGVVLAASTVVLWKLPGARS